MKLLIHDVAQEWSLCENKADKVIFADGRYAPCQGCFACWTKHPAVCRMKDSLYEISRIIGQADELVLVTENTYGGYSQNMKNVLDRSISVSTPLSTYRKGQMHHTLRYGRKQKMTAVVYGEIAENEKKTWQLMVERNAINWGFTAFDVVFAEKENLEAVLP